MQPDPGPSQSQRDDSRLDSGNSRGICPEIATVSGLGLDADRLLAGIADAALTFSLGLSVLVGFTLPAIRLPYGLVSAVTRANHEPLSNYAYVLVPTALAWLAFWFGYRRRTSLIEAVFNFAKTRWTSSRLLRVVAWAIVVLTSMVTVINASIVETDFTIDDGYHEGESIGFIPAIALGAGVLSRTFVIHGLGVDLLPALASVKLSNADNAIGIARIAQAVQRGVGVAACAIALYFLCARPMRRAPPIAVFFTAILAFVIWHQMLKPYATELAIFSVPNPRDTVYLLQLSLALTFAAFIPGHERSGASLGAGFILGIMVPVGVLYSYDRGLYGMFFSTLVVLMFALLDDRRALSSAGAYLIGLILGCLAVWQTVGTNGVAAIAEQVTYWAKNGRFIWSLLSLKFALDGADLPILFCAVMVLPIPVFLVWRTYRKSGNFPTALADHPSSILIVIASIPYLRVVVERGNSIYLGVAVLPAALLLSSWLSVLLVKTLAAGRIPTSLEGAAPNSWRPLVWAMICILVSVNLATFNPNAISRVRSIYWTAQKPDVTRLDEKQLITVASIGGEVKKARCFFTLTSEGVWYQIFDRPSCSRFHHLVYARTIEAQQEIVRDLREMEPDLILFSNRFWSNATDGVSVFNSNAVVLKHVLAAYEPYRLVAGNWFWRRSNSQRLFTDRQVGTITSPPITASRAFDTQLTGQTSAEIGKSSTHSVYVTVGPDNQVIWAGHSLEGDIAAGKWSATIPTAALQPGKHLIRVWIQLDRGDPMLRLGRDVTIHLDVDATGAEQSR